MLRRCVHLAGQQRYAAALKSWLSEDPSHIAISQACTSVSLRRHSAAAEAWPLSNELPVRTFASTDPYSSLSIGDIHRILDAGSVDYRDCLERHELVARLQQAQAHLPPHLKSQLDVMMQQKAAPASAAPASAALAATSALFLDEQYVVSLFQAAKPAVVHVTTTREAQGMFGMNPMRIPQGSGSGFLWDSEGHVVTNYHVVQGARSAKITLFNNQTFDAELKGSEPDKDLAVLKIVRRLPAEITPISVTSSSNLQVGQRVFAIGFPFALDQSLTAGIVSGLGREMQSITGRTIRDVVQTDAAINPGNSGGPLLNSRGQLIGVNTMIYSKSGANHGIGFCIPSDTVRWVVNQIIRHGRVIRPGLGVACLPDEAAANVLGPGQQGVIVREVVPGSGAAQAGLRGLHQDATGNIRIGDIIVSVGSQPVARVEDVVAAVEQFSIGDQVPLGVRRGSQVISVSVPLLKELGSAGR
ncbi:hypothetical protein WJX73_003060 [Symbiochloris irregularis]|uniref:PDZ domain-containing protein n=1 Tax=Symbiochloris irregularis TaxID=706552 RepID=A0AAW1P050_9CHLO